MSGSMYVAASGAILQQLKLEVISNNIANVNTPGFKEDLSMFRLIESSADSISNSEETNMTRQRISPYAPPFDIRTDFSSGPIKNTGNKLDIALSGDGFFAIQSGNDVRYTRQGNFRLNEAGVLVTQNGDAVLGQGGELTIEGGTVYVGKDGTLEVDGEEIGQIRVVRFDDLRQLKKVGDTMFELKDGAGPEIELEADDIDMNQGFLELSNVNPIRSMTDMIEAIRVSETYQKVIHSVDEATSKAIKEVGTI